MAVERAPRSLWAAGYVRQILLAAIALVLAWGMIYYYNGVLIPIRERHSQLAGARGNLPDIYPIWLASRELLWRHRNPYSAEMTRDIQRGFYGQPIDASQNDHPKDVEAFVYPVYVAFLLAPLLPLSFDVVSPLFWAVLLVATAASLPLWRRALGLRLRTWSRLLAWIAWLSCFAVVDGLHLEQITLLMVFLMAASLTALTRDRPVLAAILLAMATVKPQLVILVVVFLLLWTLGDWRSRRRFAIAFGCVMAVLLTGSELLLPGWFHLWRQALQAFVGYHRPSLLQSAFGRAGATIVAAGAVILCGMIFWRFRKRPSGSREFNFALAVALTLTMLCLPTAAGANYNQAVLLPAVLWMLISGRSLADNGVARVMWVVAVNTLAWEWILALPVSFAAFALHHRFEHEATWFVAGTELVAYVFPLALALFLLSVAPEALRLRASASS